MLVSFIRYELQKDIKIMLSILLAVIIGLTGIYLSLSFLNTKDMEASSVGIIPLGITIISIIIIFIGSFVGLIYLVTSYKKDINENQANLIFSLPLTGYQILFGKLIKAVVWFLAIFSLSLLYLYLLTRLESEKLFDSNLEIFQLINAFLNFVYNIMLIYFSISFTKVLSRNKKVGSSWFFVYLFLSISLALIYLLVADKIGLNYNLITKKFESFSFINSSKEYKINGGLLIFNTRTYLNIGITVSMLINFILNFILTGYFLDNKIEI